MPTLGIIVLLGGLILFLLIPSFEESLVQSKKENLNEINTLAISLLADYNHRVKSGELTLAEAQARALDRLQELRYGPLDSDYFWVYTREPVMLMHPYRPDLVGKDIAELEDLNGFRFIAAFNRLVAQDGEGYLEYTWQLREERTQFGRKLSQVKLFEPWGWIVGTGLYLDDLQAALQLARRGTYGVIGLLLLFVGGWSAFTTWRTLQAEEKREKAVADLATNEAQLSTLFDSAVQFIALLDAQGRVLKVNQTALRFIDRTAPEVIGSYFWETDWYNRDEAVSLSIKNSIKRCQHGEAIRMETMTYGAEQAVIYLDGSFTPIFSTEKQVSGIVAEGRDISQRKLAEREIKKQLKQLDALHHIDQVINKGSSLVEVVKVIFEQIQRLYQFDGLSFWQLEPESQRLINILDWGFKKPWKATQLALGEGLAGSVALERKIVYRSDREWFSQADMGFLQTEGFVDFAGFPLITHGKVVGVLEVLQRSEIVMEGKDWHFLDVIAGQAAIALDNADLVTNLQRTNIKLSQSYDLTLEGWAKALELRDEDTEGHSRRLIQLTLQLCHRMGVEEEALLHIRRGAILHDVGKMGIPDSILLKAGPLTAAEWEIMKAHPVYAYKLLSPIPFLKEALDIPYCHHEWWNGEGYPRGLRGEQIPLAARVFSIIDVWDALSHDRPYRKAWDAERVKAYIGEQSGKQFDPRVVQQFMALISERIDE